MSLFYAGGLLAWQVARLTPLGRWGPFELADIFGLALYLPLPLLLLVGLARRDRRGIAWLAPPLALLVAEYGVFFLPRGRPPAGTPLRVMTANVLITNHAVGPLAAALAEQRPDVVAVQELGESIADGLAQALGDRYPHRALFPEDSPSGIGLFSRYPIRRAGALTLGAQTCSCQEVALDLDGRAVTVLNVHPPPPTIPSVRLGRLPVPVGFDAGPPESVLGVIVRRAEAISGPLIIVGDFNVSDRQPAYRALRRRWHDAHHTAGRGFGFTFPKLKLEGLPLIPLVRIDYVFYDAAWAARAAWVEPLPGSDHRAVVADLVLQPESAGRLE